MKKNKNKNENMVDMDVARKEAEAVVLQSEELMMNLMHVMSQHTTGEHPTLVALMGMASLVAEIVKMQEDAGITDARERFLYLLANEITLREMM